MRIHKIIPTNLKIGKAAISHYNLAVAKEIITDPRGAPILCAAPARPARRHGLATGSLRVCYNTKPSASATNGSILIKLGGD